MTKPCIRVVSAEIERDGCYLITQRPVHAVLPSLWEFPGGRVRVDEDDSAALVRCLQQRVGAAVLAGERVLEVVHTYDDYNVVLVVYRCSLVDGEPTARSVAAVAWVPAENLVDYEFPGADQNTVAQLLDDD